MTIVARPTKDLAWSTDANFTNGGTGIAGTPTKVEPSSPTKAEGNVPGTPAAAQTDNWWKGIAGDWQAWFKALIGTDEELTYQTGKARTVIIPFTELGLLYDHSSALKGWEWAGSTDTWVTRLNAALGAADLNIDLTKYVRTGQIITRVKAVVKPGVADGTAGNRMGLTIVAQDWSGAAPSDSTLVATVRVANVTTDTTIDTGVVALDVDCTRYTYRAKVTSNNSGSGFDLCYGLLLTYTDKGPRNAG